MASDGGSLSPSGSGSIWSEHKAADGRTYWYHKVNKTSVWEKPEDLWTSRERALHATSWKSYKAADGRTYYVHSQTQESKWTVPPEIQRILDTIPAEENDVPTPGSSSVANTQAANAAGSPVTTAAAQRSGFDSQTPDADSKLVYAGPPPGFASPASAAVASPGLASGLAPGPAPGPPPQMPGPAPKPLYSGVVPGAAPGPPPGAPPIRLGGSSGLPALPSAAAAAAAASTSASDLAFSSKDAAESAFIDLLRSKGVNIKWTWEDTIRHIVTEPMYKALKTLAERKAAFGKYIRELQEAEAKERQERKEKLLPLWRDLIQGYGKAPDGTGEAKVKVYTSFDTAEKWFSGKKEWNAAASREEAKELYGIIQKESREKEEAFNREIRHRNMDMLMSLFKTFEADVFTTWADAHRTALSSEEFQSDEHLGSMDPTDMLIVWEEHMKTVEKDESDRLKKITEVEQTKARKNRKAFVELLQELKTQGGIKAGTTWSTVYKVIHDDERLVQMLGQPGSTPLELFYDLVDELDTELDERLASLEETLKKKGFQLSDVLPAAGDAEVKEVAEWTGFAKVVEGEHKLTNEELEQCYEEMRRRVEHEQSRARARAERRLRHAIDELRYEMKRVEFSAEELELSYEDIVAKLDAECPEFKAEKDEAVRKGAWEKFVRRHKEKAEERKDHRERERDPERRDRDRSAVDPLAEGAGKSSSSGSRKRKGPPLLPAESSPGDAPQGSRAQSRSRSPAGGSGAARGGGISSSGTRRTDRDRAARRSGV
ncbi:hypothetical protein A4X13_0g5400 [Tilletia indica]|uniref:Uncharacterized protein n=1 Tax=Tilletia indica TaxID=43049 RepID=A0A177TV56_9BASI|nr:hypothetical protein A4X13_0g5400 [Tilletia indica]